MVAARKNRKVVWCVVRSPESNIRSKGVNQPMLHKTSRPSDLLPWADPYIAQLVRNLQHEVRNERLITPKEKCLPHAPVSELEPPSPLNTPDWLQPSVEPGTVRKEYCTHRTRS